MSFVFLIIFLFFWLDLFFWVRMVRRLASAPRNRAVRFARVFFNVFMALIVIFMIATMLAYRHSAQLHEMLPAYIPAIIYVWHFLVLPISILIMIFGGSAGGISRMMRRKSSPTPQQDGIPQVDPSRRRFLTAGAAMVPPLVAFSLAGTAIEQIGKFRVRKFHLALPKFPRQLDGLSLAVVADVHTGVFTTPKMLKDVAEATNNLRADLIYLAGDLINISHRDLPQALDMVARLDAPAGVVMIQGNHDVIEGPPEFNAACRARGVNLLVDQSQSVRYRGAEFQLLGMRWTPYRVDMMDAVDQLVDKSDPDLFPILLAHHPHAWDEATARKVPLTISGHTHGGQIMLTKNIGAGPIRFKYWSGLYQRENTNLIVSNGVGNWFPLRINAPAEILQVTLHSA